MQIPIESPPLKKILRGMQQSRSIERNSFLALSAGEGFTPHLPSPLRLRRNVRKQAEIRPPQE